MKSKATSHPFNAVDRAPRLSDRVAEQLTEAIVSRRLVRGKRLASERELGDQFGVSRTVIREAVRSLVARGLVKVTAGRGVEVCQVGSDNVAASIRLFLRGHGTLDYGKVHEVRMAAEVQIAALAAMRANAEDIKRLQKSCDDYQASLLKRDFVAAGKSDYQFHQDLARASGNELLVAMLDSAADVLQSIRDLAIARPGVAESGLKAHKRILECVVAGDSLAARSAMEKHLTEAQEVWRQPAPGRPTAKKRKNRSSRVST